MTKNYYLPETKEEAAWEIVGRVNAVHDYLVNLADERKRNEYYSDVLPTECRVICGLLGFADVWESTKGDTNK